MRLTAPNEQDSQGAARRWREHRVSSSLSHIPAKPGLYAIGHDESVEGLESARTYVYIGQTKNLKRRFTEHSLPNEPKPGLKRYLKQNIERAKYWYTTEVDPNSLHKIERILIRSFRPKFNDQF